MDVNYHSNRILSSRANPSFYSGSTNRQYGSGLGSALRLGLKSFVIPLAKRYGLPLAKNLVQSAAPEVLGIIEGRTKPKAALKKTLRETVKKQIGSGRSRRKRKRSSTKKGRRRLSSKPRRRTKTKRRTKSKKKRSRYQRRKSKGSTSKTIRKRSTRKKRVLRTNRRRTAKKKKNYNKQDFFSSIVDAAT